MSEAAISAAKAYDRVQRCHSKPSSNHARVHENQRENCREFIRRNKKGCYTRAIGARSPPARCARLFGTL